MRDEDDLRINQTLGRSVLIAFFALLAVFIAAVLGIGILLWRVFV